VGVLDGERLSCDTDAARGDLRAGYLVNRDAIAPTQRRVDGAGA